MSSTFLDTRRPKAAKTHVCEWCADLIAVGEEHFLDVGIYEGDFYSTRLHLDCRPHLVDSVDAWDGEYCPERHYRGKACTH